MGRYYPYGVFCDKYGCWCDDVIEITFGLSECNGDCGNCDYSSEPECFNNQLKTLFYK